MKDLGYDPKDYGLHSLRSGGATAVITNNASKAVSERLLKLHGRWKTDEAKDMYVLESEFNRLRWLDSLKNDDIHQKHEVFENIIFKALEHL